MSISCPGETKVGGGTHNQAGPGPVSLVQNNRTGHLDKRQAHDSREAQCDKSLQGVNNGERVLDTSLQGVNNGERVLDTSSQGVNNGERVLDTSLQGVIYRERVLDTSLQGVINRDRVLDTSLQDVNNGERVLDTSLQGVNNRDRVLDTSLQGVINRDRVLDTSLQDVNNGERVLDTSSQGVKNGERVLDTSSQGVNNRDRVLDTSLQDVNNRERVLQAQADANLVKSCNCFSGNGKDKNAVQRALNALDELHEPHEFSEKPETCYPTRRTTSESTDSGVGVDLVPEDCRRGALHAPDHTHPNTNSSNQFSYKSFIMDLRQSRQKSRLKGTTGTTAKDGDTSAGNRARNQASNYVILGHSPRAQNTRTEETNLGAAIHGQDKDGDSQSRQLGLPALSVSTNGSFSPSFPPISMSGPNPHSSPSPSPPVFSSISGLGQQCVKYNTFISSSGGSFYYSSKPIPGFRHGNRYFLHLDKNNCTTCDLGVTGVPSNALSHNSLSCDSFAPKFIANHNAALGKAHSVRDTSGYTLTYSNSHRPPPPPPNSTSCSPFSYLSGERIELQAIGMQRKHNVLQHRQSPVSPLRLRTNSSSLQIHQLSAVKDNASGDSAFHGAPDRYSYYSHTDFNTNITDQRASHTAHTSVEQQRRPVRILASLRDLYGIDPWKRSKSERADLSRAVRKGQKTRQDGTKSCDLSPTVTNPEYNSKFNFT